jgi:predicted component of type VI protein secretion system
MQFKLLVIRGEPRGKYLVFPVGEFMIGRGSECHIRPNSDWVSRQHCLLRITRSTAHLRDLGSTNGTLLNGVRVVGESRLCDGDKLQVGPLVFEARLEESIVVSKSGATALAAKIDEAIKAQGTTTEIPSLPVDSPPSPQDTVGPNGSRSIWPTPPPSAAQPQGPPA